MKLTDTDALRKAVRDDPEIDGLTYARVMRHIIEAKREDAAPVVHGRWISRIDNETQMHECSVCGARVVKGLYEYDNPNKYCYHCGAKMKEKNHE